MHAVQNQSHIMGNCLKGKEYNGDKEECIYLFTFQSFHHVLYWNILPTKDLKNPQKEVLRDLYCRGASEGNLWVWGWFHIPECTSEFLFFSNQGLLLLWLSRSCPFIKGNFYCPGGFLLNSPSIFCTCLKSELTPWLRLLLKCWVSWGCWNITIWKVSLSITQYWHPFPWVGGLGVQFLECGLVVFLGSDPIMVLNFGKRHTIYTQRD